MTAKSSPDGAGPPPPHAHDGASGRSLEALGLCEATEACRRQGHTLARSSLPRSSADPEPAPEICVSCTGAAGRLDGLRLWQSVCPCCFGSAFPDGLPTLESMHDRTLGPASKENRKASSPEVRSGKGERGDG